MNSIKNDRYLRALLRQPVDQTPVWLMRQAGRYLPEYRALRAQAGDFMTLCKTPELACEATMQPLRRYDLDAAILFSDILTIPDAMGLGLTFGAGEGPRFAKTIRSARDVAELSIPDPTEELRYVMDAVKAIKTALNGSIPLIGFSGSPWTLATYMVEGGSSKQFSIIKKMMYQEPATMHALLQKIARSVTDYLNAQIEAGADAIMIFDTWGGALAHQHYLDFSLDYMKQIIAGLNQRTRRIPVTVFTKGGGNWLPFIADSGCDAVGLDWTVNLHHARALIGHKVALQGNMDPSVLLASDSVVESNVERILAEFGHGDGHVFNLGHGITPDVDPERVTTFVNSIHAHSKMYHAGQ